MDRFTRDGLTFAVRDGGPTDADAVVLLHGFPEDGRTYARVVPILQEAGLRTLVPDQRGYSPWARPRGRRPYRIDELVDDVLALLDAAGLRAAHVVGHDWGAGVAWELARRHPDRVRTLTALSVPHPAAVASAAVRSAQVLRSWYIAAVQVPALPERRLAGRVADLLERTGLNPEDAAAFGARFATPASLTGPLNWYRAIPFTLADRATWRGPRRIPVPTTYVWGHRDPFVDRVSARSCMRHVVGDYRFVELDATHWLPQNHPEDVARVVLERIAG